SGKSFEECARAFISAHEAGWGPKSRQQWVGSLAADVFPRIGGLPIGSIDTGLVMSVIEPIWKTKTETATRVRGRIEAVLDWAKVRGYRNGENPARWRGHLDHLLPPRNKVQRVEHYAALPYAEIRKFMKELRARQEMPAVALEFLVLTATR